MLTYWKFKRTVIEYAEVYNFPRPSARICRSLWGVYSQNINANCHDVTVDIAQFLDQRHDMLDSIPTPTSTLGYSIDYSTWDATPIPAQPEAKCCKKEEKNSMTVTDTYKTERDYLIRRINDTYWVKAEEMAQLYNMRNPSTPQTYKQLIDAIKNDKYTLDEKIVKKVNADDNDARFWGPFYGIVFKMDNAPDTAGYNAAIKVVEKNKQAAMDIIKTGTPADGLKALQDFEGWQPTKVG